ncbi:ATP-grasp fold amidoligase family protein [Prevotella sp.]|uniref:ATP-grasp fold amidoligase family protein n=1 Tax=Prevotella sp. TaxID=59823 RepID=UPI0027E26D59|nr:ATP-grasp fold amidoligase family protein [Prevotella sp.]
MLNKIFNRIKNPQLIVLDIFNKFSKYLTDEQFLRYRFRIVMGKRLDLKNPTSYNEKLQWLKLYDRNPLYTKLVDKVAVKDYVASIIGNEYIIPTLKVYKSPEEVRIEDLPERFVLKTNHDGDSLGVFVCKDKKNFDFNKAISILSKNLQHNYYYTGREWPYKNVNPVIFAEEYKEDEFGELRDYKFFCFNGVVKALFVATDRSVGHVKFDYFDRDFNHLDFTQSHPMSNVTLKKPDNFEKMIELAERLSKGLPHVRIDLYNCNGKIYFGEMTFYHYGGMIKFHPEEWDYKFGSWLQLPKYKRTDEKE